MTVSPDDIAKLELLGMRAWPPATMEQIHGWRLGFTGGVTRRANAVLPLAWPAESDPECALDDVERRYRRRELRPCFKMTRASEPAALEQALDARGYGREGASRVLVSTTDAVISGAVTSAAAGGTKVRYLTEASPEWLATSGSGTEDPFLARVRQALFGRITAPHVFALAHSSGRPCGTALAVAEDGWAGVTAVHTLAAHRRQGIARDLVFGLARWARDLGQGSLYLQVEADNQAAVGLYEALGFRFAYGYHYRATGA